MSDIFYCQDGEHEWVESYLGKRCKKCSKFIFDSAEDELLRNHLEAQQKEAERFADEYFPAFLFRRRS